MPGPGGTAILLFVLPCVVGMTGIHHCAQPLVQKGSHKVFPRLASNHDPPKYIAGFTGVSHCAWPGSTFYFI
jgi:hypothetical protein